MDIAHLGGSLLCFVWRGRCHRLPSSLDIGFVSEQGDSSHARPDIRLRNRRRPPARLPIFATWGPFPSSQTSHFRNRGPLPSRRSVHFCKWGTHRRSIFGTGGNLSPQRKTHASRVSGSSFEVGRRTGRTVRLWPQASVSGPQAPTRSGRPRKLGAFAHHMRRLSSGLGSALGLGRLGCLGSGSWLITWIV